MPEGPLGFPRLTSIGPFTTEEIDRDLTADDLALRGHSIRNYKPEEFRVVARNSGKPEAREELRAVEGGRFNTLLKSYHEFFRALDPDERRTWANGNPLIMEWVNVWAFLEDLIEFDV